MIPAEVATKLLRQFNEWRRGDYEPSEQPEPPNPYEVGLAIDAAVEMIDRLEAAEKSDAESIAMYRKARARAEEAEAEAIEQARLNGMGSEREAALMAKMEAAEKDVTLKELVIDALGSELNVVAKERDALRAKIEAMERQKPVAFALYSGWARKAVYLSELEACEQRDRRQLTADLSGSLEAYRVAPLYTSPGAKGD